MKCNKKRDCWLCYHNIDVLLFSINDSKKSKIIICQSCYNQFYKILNLKQVWNPSITCLLINSPVSNSIYCIIPRTLFYWEIKGK